LTAVVWTFSALTDVEDIRRYLGTFNPHAAQRIAARLIAVGNSLANFLIVADRFSAPTCARQRLFILTSSATASMAIGC
jgi:plasmid stabilization system protein ParE